MAFTKKFGNIVKQAISSNPSLYQAIRCMSSSKLFVRGLSYSTDDQSLREAFTDYGQVIEARVIVDRETGRSRGFGFVTFTSSEEASNAISGRDGKELHGRLVRVNYATDRARGGDGYGGGWGGSYGSGGGSSYDVGGASGGYGSGAAPCGYGGGGASGGYVSVSYGASGGGAFGGSDYGTRSFVDSCGVGSYGGSGCVGYGGSGADQYGGSQDQQDDSFARFVKVEAALMQFVNSVARCKPHVQA